MEDFFVFMQTFLFNFFFTLVDVPIYILGPETKLQAKYFNAEKVDDGQEIYENLLYLGNTETDPYKIIMGNWILC